MLGFRFHRDRNSSRGLQLQTLNCKDTNRVVIVNKQRWKLYYAAEYMFFPHISLNVHHIEKCFQLNVKRRNDTEDYVPIICAVNIITTLKNVYSYFIRCMAMTFSELLFCKPRTCTLTAYWEESFWKHFPWAVTHLARWFCHCWKYFWTPVVE
jgi:hypothetical protein